MSNTKKYLGTRIQEIRRKKHFKQAELAEMVEIDPKHMSKIECGRCFPSFELLDKISEKLDIPISDFFNIEHLKSKEDLIEAITKLLNTSNIEDVRCAYKLLKEIL